MTEHSRNKDRARGSAPSVAPDWLIVNVSGSGSRPSVAKALLELGGSSVQELPGGALSTWIRLSGQPAMMERLVREKLALVGDPVRIDCSVAPDRDWLEKWRSGLRPRRIGSRVVIAPTGTSPVLGPEDLLVELDPEMAFGTGEHGSTRTAIHLLADTAFRGKKVLDVGAGSGILSIVAAKLGAEALALEADAEAVRTAERNVGRNRVEALVRVVHLRVDRSILALLRGTAFDVIVVNVERSFTEPLLPALAALLEDRGELIVAGILDEEKATLGRAAREAGLELRRHCREEEWWAGAFTLVAPEA